MGTLFGVWPIVTLGRMCVVWVCEAWVGRPLVEKRGQSLLVSTTTSCVRGSKLRTTTWQILHHFSGSESLIPLKWPAEGDRGVINDSASIHKPVRVLLPPLVENPHQKLRADPIREVLWGQRDNHRVQLIHSGQPCPACNCCRMESCHGCAISRENPFWGDRKQRSALDSSSELIRLKTRGKEIKNECGM